MDILLYLSGVVTSISVIGMIYFIILYQCAEESHKKEYDEISTKNSRLNSKVSELISKLNVLEKYKSDRESFGKTAVYTWKGWHLKAEEKDPNRKIWEVRYDLKQVASSSDGKKVKFDVISAVPTGGTSTPDFYINYFNTNTGGWVDVDDSNLMWTSILTKEERRDITLEQILS